MTDIEKKEHDEESEVVTKEPSRSTSITFNEYLELNADRIINYVATHHGIEDEIAEKLSQAIPMGRDGRKWIDKAHKELSVAVIQTFWLGCLARQKEKRPIDPQNPEGDKAFPAGTAELFKKIICDAFEAGRKVGETRP